MAVAEIAPSTIIMSRSEWIGQTTLPRLGYFVPRRDRTGVMIHHTVTPDSDQTKNVWENESEVKSRMRNIQVSRPDLGLDVPYNFVLFIMENGDNYFMEGRGEDRTAAHSIGYNTNSIGISLAGNFEHFETDDDRLRGAIESISLFCNWLKTSASHPDYGNYNPMVNLGDLRPSGRKVFAHSDVKATACPGQHVMPMLNQISF